MFVFDISIFAYIQKLPWLRRSREVVEEYLGFLGNLVSAQTVHLRPCLRMIVSQFVPPRITIRDDDVDISDSDDDDENLSENFNTCHRALQTVARYVPSTPQFLMPILVENFPFINKSERTLKGRVLLHQPSSIGAVFRTYELLKNPRSSLSVMFITYYELRCTFQL
ncbi:RNA polymerase I-specific transcription initiation factor RRN3 [Egretta garzetta]|uniref:RNA polymerase I-specific transcription initiation factor RRN3 n=1 Tax=Egretta garzetta TaxID=188379 RepID=UPI00163CFA0F|nr:RNA polymerase I-specific transcription initiation factor RRN3 [Egretta garzetta]